MYEYVPQTNQSQLTQIDQVDDLQKKNLLTYAIRSRLLEQAGSSSFNWLDFTMAQSYHAARCKREPGLYAWRIPAVRVDHTTAATGDSGH